MKEFDKNEGKSKFVGFEKWANAHINLMWLIILAIGVLFFSYYILLGVLGCAIIIYAIIIMNNGGMLTSFLVVRWTCGIFFLISLSLYALKLKGRNSRWAACLLLPLGFIVPWILMNKAEQSKQELSDKR
ncbi:MAG: hypothetical protein WB588_06235 [Dehalococcoidia bacterium]